MLDFICSIISYWFSWFWYCTPVLFLIYYLVDFHYYLRVIVAVAVAKRLRSKISFTDPSEVYGIVLPNDADFLFTHMNNGRYFREYDFARFDHAARSGLFEQMQIHGGGFPVAAHTIRYRLSVMMFSVFKIVTRPVYWDAKFIYVDQRIITLKDSITRSVGYAKITVNFNIEHWLAREYPGLTKPEVPEDLKKWMDYLSLSSDMMKKSN